MEYRYGNGWKIFIGVISALFIFGGCYLFYRTLNPSSGWPVKAGLIGAVVMLVVGALLWLDAARTRVFVDDQTFSIMRMFQSKSILLKDIDGYRKGEKERFSIQAKESSRKVDIPQNLAGRKELIQWITQRYEDLDARENAAETAVLLEDQRFGLTKEEREARLAMAKKVDTAASVIGYGVIGWSIFYPRPFELVMAVLFAAPWLAVIATWYFKGLLKLYKLKKSPYPSVVQMMGLPVLGAVIVVCRFYTIYSFGQNGWSLTIGGAVVVMAVVIAACREAIRTSARRRLTYMLMFAVVAAYCFSVVIFYNCYYDKSQSKVYDVTVTSMRVSHGKSTSYYISLSPWGHFTEGHEVSVSKDFFNDVHEQDSLKVFLNEGKLGVPWYRLVIPPYAIK